MASTSFEFRACQNPDCGLRYPRLEGSEQGKRCPICLGRTEVVARASAEREQAQPAPPAAPPTGPQVLLDNIRSAWNTGSILRSAEGFGFSHLYLCGVTPTPYDAQVRKTALGAQDRVAWSAHRNAVTLLHVLRPHGCVVWALERTETSKPIEVALKDQGPHGDLILVVGNEQAGIDPGILEIADRVVHIEMRGNKRSFNVAVAFAVAAHALDGARG